MMVHTKFPKLALILGEFSKLVLRNSFENVIEDLQDSRYPPFFYSFDVGVVENCGDKGNLSHTLLGLYYHITFEFNQFEGIHALSDLQVIVWRSIFLAFFIFFQLSALCNSEPLNMSGKQDNRVGLPIEIEL